MWQKENSMENERAIGYGTYERLYVLRERESKLVLRHAVRSAHAYLIYTFQMGVLPPSNRKKQVWKKKTRVRCVGSTRFGADELLERA